MEFEDQLNAIVYFHLEEYTSGHHLLQALQEDEFAHSIRSPDHEWGVRHNPVALAPGQGWQI